MIIGVLLVAVQYNNNNNKKILMRSLIEREGPGVELAASNLNQCPNLAKRSHASNKLMEEYLHDELLHALATYR